MKLSAALVVTLTGVAAVGDRPELRMIGEHAVIALGPKGDTRLERQGAGELLVQASVDINGTLTVREDLSVNGLTVGELVAAEVTAQLEDAVGAEVEAQLADTVAAEVEAQLADTVGAEITAQLADAVAAEIDAQLSVAVAAELAAQLADAVATEVASQLEAAVAAEVKTQLEAGGCTYCASGGTGRVYTSCQDWFLAWQGNLPDGVYSIQVLGAAIDVYCDMRNGGFTRVINVLSTTAQSAYIVTGAVSAGTTASTAFYKLSDDQINAIAGAAGKKDYLYICGDEVRSSACTQTSSLGSMRTQ
jgi:hypothetical protein